MTVEKLIQAEIPKRVQYLRVIIMELARISDHIICNTVIGVDTGALTGFVYLFQFRELIYEIYEEICGARLTTNIGRIGGFERDFNDKAWKKIDKFLKEFPEGLKEFENLVKRNRIFMDRTIGAGPISAERALNYSFAGPNLRAAGVDRSRSARQRSSGRAPADLPRRPNGDCGGVPGLRRGCAVLAA